MQIFECLSDWEKIFSDLKVIYKQNFCAGGFTRWIRPSDGVVSAPSSCAWRSRGATKVFVRSHAYFPASVSKLRRSLGNPHWILNFAREVLVMALLLCIVSSPKMTSARLDLRPRMGTGTFLSPPQQEAGPKTIDQHQSSKINQVFFPGTCSLQYQCILSRSRKLYGFVH